MSAASFGIRLEGPAEPGEVTALGVAHVVDDLVQAAAAAARTLRERLPARLLGRHIECKPARFEQLSCAGEIFIAHRREVGLRWDAGRAEVRRRVSRVALDALHAARHGHVRQQATRQPSDAQEIAGAGASQATTSPPLSGAPPPILLSIATFVWAPPSVLVHHSNAASMRNNILWLRSSTPTHPLSKSPDF